MKSRSPSRRAVSPANDNARPKRLVETDLPADFPVTEIELEIVETYFSAIIAELAGRMENSAANDNEPASIVEAET